MEEGGGGLVWVYKFKLFLRCRTYNNLNTNFFTYEYWRQSRCNKAINKIRHLPYCALHSLTPIFRFCKRVRPLQKWIFQTYLTRHVSFTVIVIDKQPNRLVAHLRHLRIPFVTGQRGELLASWGQGFRDAPFRRQASSTSSTVRNPHSRWDSIPCFFIENGAYTRAKGSAFWFRVIASFTFIFNLSGAVVHW